MKKGLILLLILALLISTIVPFSLADNVIPNGGNQLQMIGNSTISSSALSGKKYHKEHYTVLPQSGNVNELVGSINWTLQGSPNGVTMITSGGSQNNEVDLIFDKSKLETTTLTLVAVSTSHGTFEKNIVIQRNKVSQIKSIDITPLSQDAIYLNPTNLVSYTSSYRMLTGKQLVSMEYKVDVWDESFPVENVTNDGSPFTVSIQGGNIPGISVSKTSPSTFKMEIDRETLGSNNLNYTVLIQGNTINGVSFTRTINYMVVVDGTIGSSSVIYAIKDLKPITERPVYLSDITDAGFVQFEMNFYKNNTLINTPPMNWTIPVGHPSLSINNGTLTIGAGTPTGKYTIRATYPGNPLITKDYNIFVAENNTYVGEISYDDGSLTKSVIKPTNGSVDVPIQKFLKQSGADNSDRTLSYEVIPSGNGVSVVGNNIQILNTAVKTDYVIKTNIDNPQGGDVFVSNEIKLRVLDNIDIDNNKRQTLNINSDKNYLDIPLSTEGNSTITPTIYVREAGIDKSFSVNKGLIENPTGVTYDGNNINITSSAPEGYYTFFTRLSNLTEIMDEKVFFLKKNEFASSAGWTITSTLLDEDPNNIVIPTRIKKNIILDTVVQNNGSDENQPVKYTLLNNPTGINMINNIISIADTASAGNYTVEVSLVNNPNVKYNRTFKLVGGNTQQNNYTMELRLNNNITSVNIPKQSDPNTLIPYITIIRNNGIIDTSKVANVRVMPATPGVSIVGNNVVIKPTAAAGDYFIIAEMNGMITVNQTKALKVVDPNAGSNIKTIYMLTPDSIIVPKKGTNTVSFDYEIRLNGKATAKENITWKLETLKDGISLSSSGVLSVSSNTNPGDIWIKASLNSDSAINTRKKITLNPFPANAVIPYKISLKLIDTNGNSIDLGTKKEITAATPSGTYALLRIKTYDINNQEITGAECKIKFKTNIKGLKLIETGNFNEFRLNMNGIMKNTPVTLIGYSIFDETKNQSIDVNIKKADTLEAFLAFEKNTLVKKDKFGATAVVANTGGKDRPVVVVIVLYQDNKVLDLQYETATVAKYKTQTITARLNLPADMTKVKVRAFVCEGNTPGSSGRVLSKPIEIKVQ